MAFEDSLFLPPNVFSSWPLLFPPSFHTLFPTSCHTLFPTSCHTSLPAVTEVASRDRVFLTFRSDESLGVVTSTNKVAQKCRMISFVWWGDLDGIDWLTLQPAAATAVTTTLLSLSCQLRLCSVVVNEPPSARTKVRAVVDRDGRGLAPPHVVGRDEAFQTPALDGGIPDPRPWTELRRQTFCSRST